MHRALRAARIILRGPSSKRRAMIRAVIAVPSVAASLRLRGYAGTRQALEGRRPPDLGSPVRACTLVEADRAVRALPGGVECLTRSLVVWWLSDGTTTLELGVDPSTEDPEHRFHAWVERDGRVINDDPEVRRKYLPFGDGSRTPDGDSPGTFA